MKPNTNESYESWANRVRMFEHGVALQDIAQGKDPDVVMERMSRRIMDKLMHPVYLTMRAEIKAEDVETSKQSYKEKYIDRNNLKADHVEGQLFDKDE
jgi:glutamyl-tRNA reductase